MGKVFDELFDKTTEKVCDEMKRENINDTLQNSSVRNTQFNVSSRKKIRENSDTSGQSYRRLPDGFDIERKLRISTF